MNNWNIISQDMDEKKGIFSPWSNEKKIPCIQYCLRSERINCQKTLFSYIFLSYLFLKGLRGSFDDSYNYNDKKRQSYV